MTRHRPTVLASTGVLVASALCVPSTSLSAVEPAIRFRLSKDARVSLAVYDGGGVLVRELLRAEALAAGRHRIGWDGLDRHGGLLPAGAYEWRMIETQGFRSRFVTTLGVNPQSGLDGYFARNWVGDHTGAGTVCADATGVYIGSCLTEGLMQTLKQSHDARKRLWQEPQYYDGGQMTRMAANGRFVFLVQPNGNMRKLDAATGHHLAVWRVPVDGDPAADVDAHGDDLVVCYPKHGTVRWLDAESGATRREVAGLANARALTAREGGEVLVVTDEGVLSLARERPAPERWTDAAGRDFVAMDADHVTGDVYLVDRRDGERVLRYSRDGRLTRSFGGEMRPFGRYRPELLSGVTDVAADGRGGFYVTEPTAPPRRTAHFDGGTGELVGEWYGGQSFYVHVGVDRDAPGNVWGCAGEGFIHH